MPEKCCRTCAQPYSACQCPPPDPPDTLRLVVELQAARRASQRAAVERSTGILLAMAEITNEIEPVLFQRLEEELNTLREMFAKRARYLLQKLAKRGRPQGPDGFADAQEFEATLIQLIRVADAQGMDTKQVSIATLWRPELNKRRRGTGSAASVDVDIDSTIRLLRKHISCPWRELVKKALQTP